MGNPEGKQQLGRNKLGRQIILKERNGLGRHGLDSSGLRIGMVIVNELLGFIKCGNFVIS